MSEHRCPECQSPMEAGALDGLCPRCLAGLLFDPGPIPETGLDMPVALPTAPPMTTRGVLLEVPGYEVTKELARGGMGIVYRATQLEPRREVALKMLLPHQLEAAEFRERFLLEARAIARLEHPHILPVYQVGEHDGIPFFTMKLAAGGALAERRSRYRRSWREIAQLVATLAEAVQYGHERGVLHRDLKPGNVLFDDAGRPYVSDFGLAKLNDGTTPEEEPGQVVGTPRYVAPEVAGQGGEQATVSSDIYGLGVILYELLAQKPPFNALSQIALLRMVEHAPPPPPSHELRGVPYELDVLAMRCLEKDPARRFTTAAALAQELRRWLMGEPIDSIPATRREQFWRWIRQQRAVVGLTAALAVLGLVLIVLSVWVAFSLAASRRAVVAERDRARNDLVQARLGEARGLRLSGGIRVRERALGLLASAAQVDARTELRDEAAAILGRWEVGTEEARHAHTGPGMPLDFSPAFDLVLDASPAGEVRFWRRSTGQVHWRLTPKPGRVPTLLRLSSTARWVVLGMDDGRLRVLDAANGKEFWSGIGPWAGFTGDDHEFAVVSPAGRLEFHDLANPGAVRSLPLPPDPVRGVYLTASPGRPDFAVATLDHVEVLDGRDGHRRHLLPFTRGEVRSLAWKDNVLLLGDSTGGIRMWNLRSGQLRDLNAHRGPVTRLAMSPDATLVWSSSNDGVARLWHARSGQLLGISELWQPLCFNGDNSRIAYLDGASFGIAPILPPEGSVVIPLRGSGGTAVRHVEFSPDSRWLVAVQLSGVHLMDASGSVETYLPVSGAVSAHFDARSRRLLVVRRRGVQWYTVVEENRRIRLQPGEAVVAGPKDWLGPAARLVSSGKPMEPDQLVLAQGSGRIGTLDTQSMEWSLVTEGLPRVTALDVDPDRRWLALELSGITNAILPWRQSKSVWQDVSGAGLPRFNPDGRYLLLAGGELHRAMLTGSWQTRLNLDTYGGNTTPGIGDWSTYGRAFAVASPRSGVVVVSTETWLPLVRLQSMLPVTCLAFGPHGRGLAAGTDDDHLVIWSLPELRDALQRRGRLDWRENISPQGPATSSVAFQAKPIPDRLQEDHPSLTEILPRDPRTPQQVLDLGPVLNRPLDLADGYLSGSREIPSSVPSGRVELGGIPFEIRGAVQLAASAGRSRRWPTRAVLEVPEIPTRRLRLVATTFNGNDLPTGTPVFRLQLEWANAPVSEVPVRLGIEVGDGWHQPEQAREADQSRLVWEGVSESSEAARSVVRLYEFAAEAPMPGALLKRVTLVTEGSSSSALILGVTIE